MRASRATPIPSRATRSRNTVPSMTRRARTRAMLNLLPPASMAAALAVPVLTHHPLQSIQAFRRRRRLIPEAAQSGLSPAPLHHPPRPPRAAQPAKALDRKFPPQPLFRQALHLQHPLHHQLNIH